MIRRLVGTVAFLAAAVGAGAAAYAFVARPWHLRWGATPDEIERSMPGDDYILFPRVNATHAVSILARAADVWPWLVQIGRSRGGFYSYDWLENSVAGLDIHSADGVLPEHQALNVGDKVLLAPETALTVASIEPPVSLVLTGTIDMRTGKMADRDDPEVKGYVDASWAFLLDERDHPDGFVTRLVARFRADYTPEPWMHVAARAMLEPAHFAMERKMLLGIKERAEAGQIPGEVPAPKGADASAEAPAAEDGPAS
jgi:hypothetical protein